MLRLHLKVSGISLEKVRSATHPHAASRAAFRSAIRSSLVLAGIAAGIGWKSRAGTGRVAKTAPTEITKECDLFEKPVHGNFMIQVRGFIA